MKRLSCAIICLLMAVTGFAKTSLVYDVDFTMNFDNREFYRSAYSSSMTIFGARFAPAVGLAFQTPDNASHSLMVGVDVLKDFGSPSRNLSRELNLYYRLDKDLGDTDFTLYAGVFPRKAMDDRYSEAFFSDSLKFYDNNLEGLLLKFSRPQAEFELGCDWMGQYGPGVRERFMVFSSGEGKVAPVLSLGYAGYLYHFANSTEVRGVVDNILLNPYARLDLGHLMWLDEFSVRLGWLMGLQNDRRTGAGYDFPAGGELKLTMRKWKFGVTNSMYYGRDMMPYYNVTDEGGFKYGSDLYFGDPFYRVHDGWSETGPGLYDRLEIFWTPCVGKRLSVKVGARFHFNDFHYSGCQQMVRIDFNLNSLINR